MNPRAALLASALILGVSGAARAQIAVPVDIDDLFRALLDRRSDLTRSARIALRDVENDLRASLEVGAGARDQLAVVISFERSARGFFVHTVRLVDAAGRVVLPRVVDLRPLGTPGRGEFVAALLPEDGLDWLADASRIDVTLEGWDRTFTASLDEKALRKIRSFRDRRREASTATSDEPDPEPVRAVSPPLHASKGATP